MEEGMIGIKMRSILYDYHHLHGTCMNPKCWAQRLIWKLLKATHRQLIYRNKIQIHDSVAGTQATLQKGLFKRKLKSKWNWVRQFCWRKAIGY